MQLFLKLFDMVKTSQSASDFGRFGVAGFQAARFPARKFGLAPGAAVVRVLLRGQTAFAVVFEFQHVNKYL